VLTATIAARIRATQTNPLDLGTAQLPLSVGQTLTYANGTGAGMADLLWSDTRSINASSTDDLDLAGSLVNAFGVTTTFARIRALYVAAASGNTNNLVVGGASSNGFVTWTGAATDKVVIRPGGLFLVANRDTTGYAVTAATGDLLRIANSGAGSAVTYDIVIIGCSA
jgi:hypothetical protein